MTKLPRHPPSILVYLARADRLVSAQTPNAQHNKAAHCCRHRAQSVFARRTTSLISQRRAYLPQSSLTINFDSPQFHIFQVPICFFHGRSTYCISKMMNHCGIAALASPTMLTCQRWQWLPSHRPARRHSNPDSHSTRTGVTIFS